MRRTSQKIQLESLNPRLRNFSREILRIKGKRGKGMTLTLKMTTTAITVQSIRPDEPPFWTHNTEECRSLTGYQRNKRNFTQNMSKKSPTPSLSPRCRNILGTRTEVLNPKEPRALEIPHPVLLSLSTLRNS